MIGLVRELIDVGFALPPVLKLPFFGMFGAASLAGIAAAVLPTRPSVAHKLWETAKTCAGIFALGLVGFVVYTVGMRPAQPPKSLADAVGRSFVSSTVDGRVLRIVVKHANVWSDDDLVTTAGYALKEAAQWIGPAIDERLGQRDVAIDVLAPMRDRYGTEEVQRTWTMRWSRQDFGRIQWDRLTSADIVALATLENPSSIGLKTIRAWCANHATATMC